MKKKLLAVLVILVILVIVVCGAFTSAQAPWVAAWVGQLSWVVSPYPSPSASGSNVAETLSCRRLGEAFLVTSSVSPDAEAVS